jgi:hypothetical protein
MRTSTAARSWRRRTSQALLQGLLLQALLTGALLAARWVLGLHAPSHGAVALSLMAALLLPAWIGGFLTGSSAPRLRWWQPATPAVLIAFILLLVTRFAAIPGVHGWPFKLWLAANLVLGPVLGGWLGHWLRRRSRTDGSGE